MQKSSSRCELREPPFASCQLDETNVVFFAAMAIHREDGRLTARYHLGPMLYGSGFPAARYSRYHS